MSRACSEFGLMLENLAAVAAKDRVQVVTADGEWTARLASIPLNHGDPLNHAVLLNHGDPANQGGLARGALVAGLVPGYLLGWSWPDRLRHALALAAGAWTHLPGEPGGRDHVDLDAYERLLETVLVEPVSTP